MMRWDIPKFENQGTLRIKSRWAFPLSEDVSGKKIWLERYWVVEIAHAPSKGRNQINKTQLWGIKSKHLWEAKPKLGDAGRKKSNKHWADQ